MENEPPTTDRALVEAIARGDSAALGVFLDRHGGWMLTVARRFISEVDLAEDAVQESLLHLVERAPGLVVGESIRPWLYPVVRFRAQGQRRARDRHPGAMPEGVDRAGDESGAIADSDALRRAIDALPDGLRETLLLRVVDGLSVPHTALALGVPEGTVKSRLHAALATLREDPALRGLLGDD